MLSEVRSRQTPRRKGNGGDVLRSGPAKLGTPIAKRLEAGRKLPKILLSLSLFSQLSSILLLFFSEVSYIA